MIVTINGSEVKVALAADLVSPPASSTGKTLLAAYDTTTVVLPDGRKLKVSVTATLPNPAFQKAA